MQETHYHSPGSLDEALRLLEMRKGDCQVLAGGTDLAADLNEGRSAAPGHLVYLGNVREMRFIRRDETFLEIGALVSHEELETDPLVLEETPLLAAAAGTIGGPAIRTMGTVGGNIVRASPAGDISTALLCLDAWANIMSPSGVKRYGLCDFFLGPRRTRLEKDEILFSVSVPLIEKKRNGQSFLKLGKRKAVSIAIASCAVVVTLDESLRRFAEARISLGSVAPTPIRAVKAEGFLRGKLVGVAEMEKAAGLAREECDPIDDIRGSAGYRKEMVGVLVRRGLGEACHRAGKRGA
jgi:CO/xanthine dehydrogenase FAD-binding subunit